MAAHWVLRQAESSADLWGPPEAAQTVAPRADCLAADWADERDVHSAASKAGLTENSRVAE